MFFASNTFTVTLEGLALRPGRWQRRAHITLSDDPFSWIRRLELVNNFYCRTGKRRLAHCLHIHGVVVLIDRDLVVTMECLPRHSCGTALPLQTKPTPFAKPNTYLCHAECCMQARQEAERTLIQAVRSAGLLEESDQWSRERLSAWARKYYERA